MTGRRQHTRGRKTKPPYRWWEFQANKAMGALLLPKALVGKAREPFLEAQGMLGLPALRPTAVIGRFELLPRFSM